jgi:hypothetical protein
MSQRACIHSLFPDFHVGHASWAAFLIGQEISDWRKVVNYRRDYGDHDMAA